MDLETRALVMANTRRIMSNNKMYSNARLYGEVFGTGHGTAMARCRDLGLIPEDNETSYNDMMKHIDNGGES